MVQAIVSELGFRRDYFHAAGPLRTLYFGGGTPSLLSQEELKVILSATNESFDLSEVTEQTIECNPEDLTFEKLKSLKELGFNRLSIGIQTFQDHILHYINRAHTASQAKNAVKWAKKIGFDNITIDLIYALPFATKESLLADLEEAFRLDIPHISAYCFTVEEKTVFGKWEKLKKLHSGGEEFEKEQYLTLVETLAKHGYEQYEISNFAREEKYSQHNSAYWFGHHYLGIGPGAHSYNGPERQWNISNNALYLQKINQERLPQESETLSNHDKINETLLTRLRTKWGVDLSFIKEELSYDLALNKAKELEFFARSRWIELRDDTLLLTPDGKLLADKIIADLMV